MTVQEEADKRTTSNGIIRKRMYIAMGTGLVPLPIFDIVALTGVQIEMVSRLAELYDIPFKRDLAKTAITSLVGGILPVAAAPLLGSLLKVIPVVGYTTSALSLAAIGGASTYAVGKVFAQHFETGGTLLNFNAEKVKAYYQEQFEKGKEEAASAKAGKEEPASATAK